MLTLAATPDGAIGRVTIVLGRVEDTCQPGWEGRRTSWVRHGVQSTEEESIVERGLRYGHEGRLVLALESLAASRVRRGTSDAGHYFQSNARTRLSACPASVVESAERRAKEKAKIEESGDGGG